MIVKPGFFSEGWQGIIFITSLECHTTLVISFLSRGGYRTKQPGGAAAA
jgi:hypothetical protein